MKNQIYLCLFGIVLLSFGTKAQQTSLYSQYYDQPFLVNPAFLGDNGSFNAFLLARKQWIGIPNAPSTQFFSVDGNMNNTMALGLNIINDQTDILRQTSAMLSYRYKLIINEISSVNFALNGGVVFNSMDFDAIRVKDISDAAILDNAQTRYTPNFNFGVLYNYDRLKVGITAMNITQQLVRYEEQHNFTALSYKFIRHFTGHIAYTFPINDDWEVEPILLTRIMQGGEMQMDVNAFAKFRQRFWGGLTYRHGASVNASVGAHLIANFGFGYTYEYPTGDISPFTSGSHEIQLNYRIRESKGKYSKMSDTKRIEKLEEENQILIEQMDQLQARIDKAKLEGGGNAELSEEKKEEIDKMQRDLETLRKAMYLPNEGEQKSGGNEGSQINPFAESENMTDDERFKAMQRELIKNRNAIQQQQKEIESLRNELRNYRNEVDEVRSSSEAPKKEGNTKTKENDRFSAVRNASTSDKSFDYHVVLGAYKPLASAKRYQKILKAEKGLDTEIVQSNDGRFYFVCVKQTNDLDAAVEELETKYDESYMINGEPWVFKKKKQ